MSCTVRSALLSLLVLLLVPARALAHEGNPNYRSVINTVTPPVKGLTLNVLNLDDRLQLVNNTGQTVVVKDYNGKPYVRVLADGSVEQNQNSVATYINDDRSGGGAIPKGVDQNGPPIWKLIDRSGRFEWHDHRIHYMGTGRPAAIKNPKIKTKAFDWKVPISVGARSAVIQGSLYWVPQSSSGISAGTILAFVVVLLAAAAAVVVTRRRRGAAPGDDDAVTDGAPVKEAW